MSELPPDTTEKICRENLEYLLVTTHGNRISQTLCIFFILILLPQCGQGYKLINFQKKNPDLVCGFYNGLYLGEI